MITNLNIIYMTALNFDTNTLRYYNNDYLFEKCIYNLVSYNV